jgi:alkane 1-monooxygenase
VVPRNRVRLPTGPDGIFGASQKQTEGEKTGMTERIKRSRFWPDRFWIFPLMQLWTIFLLFIGGNWIFLGYQTILAVALAVDALTGKNLEQPQLDERVHSNIPELSVALHCVIFWQTMVLISDLEMTGLAGVAACGFLVLQLSAFGSHNTVVNSHELMHKNNPISFLLAMFIAAFSFRASGVIDHVYGHHRKIGLYEDNATARRHESFWLYLKRAWPGTNRFSFEFEAERLARKNGSGVLVNNRLLQGYGLTGMIVIAAYLIAGWTGVAAHLVAALLGMVVVEAGNYIAHYGLVRKPGEKIAEHHSWNNYNTLSTSLLLNLPRHSDHHLHSSRNYWELKPTTKAPCYPFGFMTMTLFALMPPLFFHVAERELQQWAATFPDVRKPAD